MPSSSSNNRIKHMVSLRYASRVWRSLLAVPILWVLAFTAVPALIVLQFSVSEMGEISVVRPWTFANGVLQIRLDFTKYQFILSDPLYVIAYLSSVKYALVTTLCCLAIAYPFAFFMALAPQHMRPLLLAAVMLPFWTSFLIRIYSWKGLLANNGIFNQLMLGLGLIHEPIAILNTPFSLVLGMVYAYLPFMILPLYTNFLKLDYSLLQAAANLGAAPLKAFWLITVPLSKNGTLAGSILVFIPSIGEYVIPELLGGPETLMIGRVLWDEVFGNNDWTMASAVSVLTITVILAPMMLLNKLQRSTVKVHNE